MKKLLTAALSLILGILSPALGSYREHKHFSPKEVGAMTRELVGTLKELETDFPGAVFGRAILTRGTGIGVRLSLEKNGQIELAFDLALEKKREGYIAASQDGIDDRRTLIFRPVKAPKFRWSLDEQAVKNLELKLSAPASRMWDYTLYHEVLVSEASEEILQSSSRVTARVWTVDQAVELVESYYSKHPESTPLWEDG
jgi:hypothetical protein